MRTDKHHVCYPADLKADAGNTEPKVRAYDALQGSGVYVFPSGIPDSYYHLALHTILQRTDELRQRYPQGDIWQGDFDKAKNPALEECHFTDEGLIRPLEEVRPRIEQELAPQIDPNFQVYGMEFITLRWYSGAERSNGVFFKHNPDKKRLELFRYGKPPFSTIHVDPGKSIVSPNTCHIKFVITLTPMGPNGTEIAENARGIGTLYDPQGCRRVEGRAKLGTSDLISTPTGDAVTFLSTRGASVFNRFGNSNLRPADFVPARGVKHRAADRRAALFNPTPEEPFAPRFMLHGGVHLRRVRQ